MAERNNNPESVGSQRLEQTSARDLSRRIRKQRSFTRLSTIGALSVIGGFAGAKLSQLLLYIALGTNPQNVDEFISEYEEMIERRERIVEMREQRQADRDYEEFIRWEENAGERLENHEERLRNIEEMEVDLFNLLIQIQHWEMEQQGNWRDIFTEQFENIINRLGEYGVEHFDQLHLDDVESAVQWIVSMMAYLEELRYQIVEAAHDIHEFGDGMIEEVRDLAEMAIDFVISIKFKHAKTVMYLEKNVEAFLSLLSLLYTLAIFVALYRRFGKRNQMDQLLEIVQEVLERNAGGNVDLSSIESDQQEIKAALASLKAYVRKTNGDPATAKTLQEGLPDIEDLFDEQASQQRESAQSEAEEEQ